MNKIKRVISFLCTFIFLFIITTGVKAEAPSTITIEENVGAHYRVDDDKEYSVAAFRITDGSIVFCVDNEKVVPYDGYELDLSGDGEVGISYILQNSYPGKQLTDDVELNKYITAKAIWYYCNPEYEGLDRQSNPEPEHEAIIINYVLPLVEKAKNATEDQINPNMTLTSNKTAMSLTSDGKYYESDYLVATVSGADTYNVTVNGAIENTVVVDESGNVGTTLNSGEKFKIRVPADEISSNTNITVTTSAVGSTKKAKIYAPRNDVHQRIVGAFDEGQINLEEQTTLSITVPEKQAQKVSVPVTGAYISLIAVMFGVLSIGAGTYAYWTIYRKDKTGTTK